MSAGWPRAALRAPLPDATPKRGTNDALNPTISSARINSNAARGINRENRPFESLADTNFCHTNFGREPRAMPLSCGDAVLPPFLGKDCARAHNGGRVTVNSPLTTPLEGLR
jgi:hypothetical protein